MMVMVFSIIFSTGVEAENSFKGSRSRGHQCGQCGRLSGRSLFLYFPNLGASIDSCFFSYTFSDSVLPPPSHYILLWLSFFLSLTSYLSFLASLPLFHIMSFSPCLSSSLSITILFSLLVFLPFPYILSMTIPLSLPPLTCYSPLGPGDEDHHYHYCSLQQSSILWNEGKMVLFLD